jgi:hypothetical protein
VSFGSSRRRGSRLGSARPGWSVARRRAFRRSQRPSRRSPVKNPRSSAQRDRDRHHRQSEARSPSPADHGLAPARSPSTSKNYKWQDCQRAGLTPLESTGQVIEPLAHHMPSTPVAIEFAGIPDQPFLACRRVKELEIVAPGIEREPESVPLPKYLALNIGHFISADNSGGRSTDRLLNSLSVGVGYIGGPLRRKFKSFERDLVPFLMRESGTNGDAL